MVNFTKSFICTEDRGTRGYMLFLKKHKISKDITVSSVGNTRKEM